MAASDSESATDGKRSDSDGGFWFPMAIGIHPFPMDSSADSDASDSDAADSAVSCSESDTDGKCSDSDASCKLRQRAHKLSQSTFNGSKEYLIYIYDV